LKSRQRAFRFLAVLLGLSVFAIFEATCRLTGWGTAVPVSAFEEFGAARLLFTLDSDAGEYRVADNRRLYFAEESFPAVKSANVRRIFLLGGSTVQGRPFSIPTSFGTFLEIALKHADPDSEWQVVNCGGISYASYRLLPMVRECVHYEPDLFIICTGHNEFLECMTYAAVISASSTLKQTHSWLDALHSVRLMRHIIQPVPTAAQNDVTVLPDEVDAMLDHQGGLDVYTRQALCRDDIATQFHRNLQEMVDVCRGHGVPLVFVSPASNLGDCPPFKSQFGDVIDAETQQEITNQLQLASQLQKDDLRGSIPLLKSIVERDPAFAFSWYQLGRSYRMVNRIDEAKAAFVHARDADICPLRMTSALEKQLLRVATENDLPLVNLQSFMERHCRDGIVDNSVLVDHVHPSFRSNQQIALELIEKLSLSKREDWQAAAEVDFDAHLQSLDDLYFLGGRRTLRSLQAWAAGRGDGPPLDSPKP
jgi:hypothetical protein